MKPFGEVGVMNRCLHMLPASGTSPSTGKDQQVKMAVPEQERGYHTVRGSWDALEYTGVALT